VVHPGCSLASPSRGELDRVARRLTIPARIGPVEFSMLGGTLGTAATLAQLGAGTGLVRPLLADMPEPTAIMAGPRRS
jgi:hypothetical protein